MCEEDNKYVTPAVVRQIIRDLNERRREEERRIKCSSCGTSFLRTLEQQVKCPKCQSVIPTE